MTRSMHEALRSLERVAERCAELEGKIQSEALKNRDLRSEIVQTIRDIDALIGGQNHA